jgi:hypothetical protein
MRVKPILHQLELSFWDAIIPLLNKSPLIRYLAPRVYLMLHLKEFQNTVKYSLILTIIGLMFGFVLGAFSQIK